MPIALPFTETRPQGLMRSTTRPTSPTGFGGVFAADAGSTAVAAAGAVVSGLTVASGDEPRSGAGGVTAAASGGEGVADATMGGTDSVDSSRVISAKASLLYLPSGWDSRYASRAATVPVFFASRQCWSSDGAEVAVLCSEADVSLPPHQATMEVAATTTTAPTTQRVAAERRTTGNLPAGEGVGLAAGGCGGNSISV